MKAKLSLLLLTVLSLCLASPTYAQVGKSSQKPPAKRKRIVIHDPVTLEKFIFDHLGLNASQKERCNSLLAKMQSEVKDTIGPNLAPQLNRKANAKRMRKIQKEYTDGLGKILTVKQKNQYAQIHKQVAMKLQQHGGMHF